MPNPQNLIPAKKGEIRNPKGKPKGLQHSKTRLKRLLEITQDLTNPITGEVEGFTVLEQLDLQQIIKARKGDLGAYREILDRLEGKTKDDSLQQNVNINFINNTPRPHGRINTQSKAKPKTDTVS
jgi:hypothetical protein